MTKHGSPNGDASAPFRDATRAAIKLGEHIEPALARELIARAVTRQAVANGWTITGITDAVMALLEHN